MAYFFAFVQVLSAYDVTTLHLAYLNMVTLLGIQLTYPRTSLTLVVLGTLQKNFVQHEASNAL